MVPKGRGVGGMPGEPMKVMRTAVFCLGCFAVFVFAAASTCFVRAGVHSIPELKSYDAWLHVGDLLRYSFLQYSQANPDEGRAALLEYVKFLQRTEDEHIRLPAKFVHASLGAAYLRLYRLESSEGNSTVAAQDMASAQREYSAAQLKTFDISTEALTKWIETDDLRHTNLYDGTAGTQAAASNQGVPRAASK